MHFCLWSYYYDTGKRGGGGGAAGEWWMLSTWDPNAPFQMASPRAKWWEAQVLESAGPESKHQTSLWTSCLTLVQAHNFSEASVSTLGDEDSIAQPTSDGGEDKGPAECPQEWAQQTSLWQWPAWGCGYHRSPHLGAGRGTKWQTGCEVCGPFSNLQETLGESQVTVLPSFCVTHYQCCHIP